MVINLGGTISTVYRNGKPFNVGIGGIAEQDSEVIDIMPVSSNNLEWKHLLLLRETILSKEKEKESRIIVTTGTDSLDEVAYFLHLTTPSTMGVVVVGALRLRSDDQSDGEIWLSRAYQWLQEDRNQGIAICCGGPPVRGPWVEKVYQDRWLFRQISDMEHDLPGWPFNRRHKLSEHAPIVPILTVGINAGDWIARTLEECRFDGVVIEAYAAGDVPFNVCDALEMAIHNSVPVILASKSHPGRIEPLFPGAPGCSYDLLSRGVLSAGQLDSNRARIRLMIALASSPRIELDSVFSRVKDGMRERE